MSKVNIIRQNALNANEKFYFTGIPCNYGHIDRRITSSRACYTCSKIKTKKSREKNLEQCKMLDKLRYIKNKEQKIQYSHAYRENNIEVIRAKDRIRAHTKKKKLKQRMPNWANKDKIALFYIKAKLMTWLTGEQHHVDHIIPLNGKLVSGLHVEDNLQVLPFRDNLSKHNKFNGEKLWVP
jgi:hypothetical protein